MSIEEFVLWQQWCRRERGTPVPLSGGGSVRGNIQQKVRSGDRT